MEDRSASSGFSVNSRSYGQGYQTVSSDRPASYSAAAERNTLLGEQTFIQIQELSEGEKDLVMQLQLVYKTVGSTEITRIFTKNRPSLSRIIEEIDKQLEIWEICRQPKRNPNEHQLLNDLCSHTYWKHLFRRVVFDRIDRGKYPRCSVPGCDAQFDSNQRSNSGAFTTQEIERIDQVAELVIPGFMAECYRCGRLSIRNPDAASNATINCMHEDCEAEICGYCFKAPHRDRPCAM